MIKCDFSFAMGVPLHLFVPEERDGKGCIITPAALKLIISQFHLRNISAPISALSAFRCEDFLPPELERLSSDFPPVLHDQMGYYHPVTEP
jgi:hypothetical protein